MWKTHSRTWLVEKNVLKRGLWRQSITVAAIMFGVNIRTQPFSCSLKSYHRNPWNVGLRPGYDNKARAVGETSWSTVETFCQKQDYSTLICHTCMLLLAILVDKIALFYQQIYRWIILFGQNMKKSKIWRVSSHSRYLGKLALKNAMTSPIVINMPTRELFAGKTNYFVERFEHLDNKSNVCKQISSLLIN